MYVFEIETSESYAVIGRVVDRSRVAGIRLSAITAEETARGTYAIALTLDTTDRDLVERLARQFGEMFGVLLVNVERKVMRRASEPTFALAATA